MMKYDAEEDLWWISKEEMLGRFIEVLVKIFKETVRADKTRIFNITLLIRQNFLSLCETPELMTSLFGQPSVWWWDEEIEDYRMASCLEDEAIEKVMKELGQSTQKFLPNEEG